MSDDADRKLSELLCRGPAPPAALDAARRAAIAAEARQAWFRARSAERRRLWLFAAAACLVTGIAGWTLRSFAEPLRAPATQTVAKAEPARQEPQRRDAETTRREAPAAPKLLMSPAMEAPPPPVTAPAPPQEAEAKRSQQRALSRDKLAEESAGAGPPTPSMPAPRPEARAASEAGAKAMKQREEMPPGESRDEDAATVRQHETAKADLVDRAKDLPSTERALTARQVAGAARREAPPIQIPADAPQRGRLLIAAAVAESARTGGIKPEDRAAVLKAALDLISGIEHPAATAIRTLLGAPAPPPAP